MGLGLLLLHQQHVFTVDLKITLLLIRWAILPVRWAIARRPSERICCVNWLLHFWD
jgi:hypothetical protein